MKSIKTSFLFFSIITLLAFSRDSYSQPRVDSLNYYINIIDNTGEQENLKKAIKFLLTDQLVHFKNNDSLSRIYNLLYISQAQRKIGELYYSENSAVEALELLDNLNSDHTSYRISLNNGLGIIYRKFKNYDQALKHYKSALLLNDNPKDKITLINNIGAIYDEKQEFKSAIENFNDAYQRSLKFDNVKIRSRALDNLGFTQSKINDTIALSNMLEALEIRKKIKYTPGIITSYLHLGEYYKNLNDNTSALKYADKAIELADLTGNSDFKINALSLYASLKNDQKIVRFINLKDSIELVNNLIQNKYASQKYNYEKEEKEKQKVILDLKESELDNEKQKNIRTIFIAISIFILLAAIFVYSMLKSKHKKDKIKEVFKTETRISRKIHDEVANDVYHVMTQLQTEPNSNKELLDDLENIYIRTRDISKQNSSINLSIPYSELLTDLFFSYKSNQVNIITKDLIQVKWENLNELKKATIYRVLQELLTNMKKHSNASIVVINFDHSGKSILINYKDNGKGCSLIKGSGISNTENRIASVNGTITFESEVHKGFHATITI